MSYAETREVISQLARFASPQFRVGLSKTLKNTALEQLRKGFAQGRDPYGVPWKPTGRSNPTLRDSGALERSFIPSNPGDANGFELRSLSIYARIHQSGGIIRPRNKKFLRFRGSGGGWVSAKSVTIPKRRMIPDDGTLGIWATPFKDAAIRYARSQVRP